MTLIGSLTLVEVECANCITHFAMDEALNRRCLKTGRKFYCPNGHANCYQDNELSQLREEREKLKQEAESARKQKLWAENQYQIEKQRHSATKGQLTKTRKRIANGVCPCCHRTFKQLASHMANKHPGFAEQP
jgi:hypothetical protein